jgi:CelD/BcsL family acetyltransferase involved in cellulose biosynthesis
MMLQVEVAKRADAFERLAVEWNALADVQAIRTPFQSAAWHRLWWKHHQRTGLKVRDELRLYTVRASGLLVAVAPMMLSQRPAYLPIRTRELQFLGADANMTEIRGMLFRPGWEDEALCAFVGYLSTQRDWDWVQWRGLPGSAAARIPGLRVSNQLHDLYLPLPTNWENLRCGLPRNMKEALRKCYNSLARDKHAWSFRVIDQPEEIVTALTNFLRMHALRSDQEGGVFHNNVFAATEARAFIVEYITECAGSGGARVFELSIGGVAVAMRIGFVYSDEVYLYYSGYDPAWGRYSVMTTVVAEAIKWSIMLGYQRVNLSTGSDVSKTRWRPAQIDYVEGTQPAAQRRGQLALAAMKILRELKNRHPFKIRLIPTTDAGNAVRDLSAFANEARATLSDVP